VSRTCDIKTRSDIDLPALVLMSVKVNWINRRWKWAIGMFGTPASYYLYRLLPGQWRVI